MAKQHKTNIKFMCLSALGIIMVVDSHSWSSLNLLCTYLPYNSFFMPLFVFISGYFNKVDKDTSLRKLIKHKCKTLLLPYLCISAISMLIQWLFECIKLGEISHHSYLFYRRALLAVFTSGEVTEIASPIWFVPTLFAVQIVYAVIKKNLYKDWNSKIAFIIFCALNIITVWYVKAAGTLPVTLMISKVFFFLPFIELGILYRDVLEKKLSKADHLILLPLLLIANLARMMLLPEPYDIAFNYLSEMTGFTSPYPFSPIISSFIGILFWVEMTDLFGPAVYENKIVNYISENTFFIMGFHIICFNILNLVLMCINSFTALPGFSISDFQFTPWYRWEYYPQFRLTYFIVGLFGSLALKQVYDRLRIKIRPTKTIDKAP